MSTRPTLSLAYLTSASLSPPDSISLAAELDYQAVGLRALPVAPGADFSPLIEDAGLLRETIARMEATGVGVFDVEIVRLGPNFNPETCAGKDLPRDLPETRRQGRPRCGRRPR